MADRTNSEIAVVEALWQTLDNQQLIKDVAYKGKYISHAIKFISSRDSITIEEAKETFFEVIHSFVSSLLEKKQLHRAIHVIKNVQILNEFYFLFSFKIQVRISKIFVKSFFQNNFHVRTKKTRKFA